MSGNLKAPVAPVRIFNRPEMPLARRLVRLQQRCNVMKQCFGGGEVAMAQQVGIYRTGIYSIDARAAYDRLAAIARPPQILAEPARG